MYTFKEDAWLHNDIEDLWYLTYIKKGNPFPNTDLTSNFSGVWACKEGYSWEFATYFGKSLKKIVKELKAKKVEKFTTQVRWPMEW
jgi:hypothetical protein